MPLHRDFLMRMIESLSEAFFRLASGRAQTDPTATAAEIQRLIAEVLGVNPEFVLGQGRAMMETLDPRVAAEVARLLTMHARLSVELGRDRDAARGLQTAFWATVRALDPPHGASSQLAAELAVSELDRLAGDRTAEDAAVLYAALFRYFAKQGRFADAEDHLFHALALAPSASLSAEATQWFDALSELEDDELETGGLSREEVLESQAELVADGAAATDPE